MPINLGRKILSTFCVMLMFSMIFQNVAAAHTFYTVEDNNANITLNSEDSFTVSLRESIGSGYQWNYISSNSPVLNLIDEGGYGGGTGLIIHNWTFEGARKGTTTLTFIYSDSWSETVFDTFFLNITSNVSRTMNNILIIIVFSVIIVVPSALIIKWMKGEEKNEK